LEELALALLVPWIFADDTHNAFAADDAARFTKGLYRWTNSHDNRDK
jgi:hypothetical protein